MGTAMIKLFSFLYLGDDGYLGYWHHITAIEVMVLKPHGERGSEG